MLRTAIPRASELTSIAYKAPSTLPAATRTATTQRSFSSRSTPIATRHSQRCSRATRSWTHNTTRAFSSTARMGRTESDAFGNVEVADDVYWGRADTTLTGQLQDQPAARPHAAAHRACLRNPQGRGSKSKYEIRARSEAWGGNPAGCRRGRILEAGRALSFGGMADGAAGRRAT